MSVYIFYRSVSSNFKETEKLSVWCKENCLSYITNTLNKDGDWAYEFRFSDEQDLVMCKLRWAGND